MKSRQCLPAHSPNTLARCGWMIWTIVVMPKMTTKVCLTIAFSPRAGIPGKQPRMEDFVSASSLPLLDNEGRSFEKLIHVWIRATFKWNEYLCHDYCRCFTWSQFVCAFMRVGWEEGIEVFLVDDIRERCATVLNALIYRFWIHSFSDCRQLLKTHADLRFHMFAGVQISPVNVTQVVPPTRNYSTIM